MKKTILSTITVLCALAANAEVNTLAGNASELDSALFSFTVPENGTPNNYSWSIAKDTSFIVDTDVTLTKTLTTLKGTDDKSITPGIIVSSGTGSSVTVKAGKTFTLASNALTANSGNNAKFYDFTLESGATFHDSITSHISSLETGATLNMASDSTFKAARLRLAAGAIANINGDFLVSNIDTRANAGTTPVINMNKAFSVRKINGNFGTDVSMMNSNNNGTLKINVNASQKLGTLIFLNNKNATDTLTLSFANNAFVSFKNISPSSDSNLLSDEVSLVLTDFTNQSLFVETDLSDKLVTLADGREALHLSENGYVILSGTDANGKALSGFSFSAETSYVDGLGTTVKGYWLQASSITTIPEPAEWAAIFGALALSLAVYRRRK